LREAVGGMEVQICMWRGATSSLLFSQVICQFSIQIKVLSAWLKNAIGYSYHWWRPLANPFMRVSTTWLKFLKMISTTFVQIITILQQPHVNFCENFQFSSGC
jgi:hypothetical protein